MSKNEQKIRKMLVTKKYPDEWSPINKGIEMGGMA